MKNLIKKLSLILVIILVLGVSSACMPKDKVEPETKITVNTNLGFVSELSQEEGKNYVGFVFNDSNVLKLEVDDIDIFNSIEKDEFYRFSFDRDNRLLSIDKDDYIKSLVLNSMNEDEDEEEEDEVEPVEKTYIDPEAKVSTEGLALLDYYEFDINGDGFEEIIAMYVKAEQGADGEIYWDDGQDWLFLVEGQEKDYVLFDDHVQLGTINFHIYTEDEDFYITTVHSGTANLDVREYKFDPEKEQFASTLLHRTTGNVNMLHSSYGY